MWKKACSTGDYAEANINTNHIGRHSLMAGFLISIFNFHGVFLLDAITFVVSFLILMRIKFPRELKVEKKKPFYEDFKEGFSVINSNKSLKTLLMSAAVINLLGQHVCFHRK